MSRLRAVLALAFLALLSSSSLAVPVITLGGEAVITAECGDIYVDEGADAFDEVDGDLTEQVITVGIPASPLAVGGYFITYDVQNSQGDSAAQVTRFVDVQDTLPPVITRLGETPFNIECGEVFVDPGATAVDACDGELSTPTFLEGTVDTTVPATYTIDYHFTDSAGNDDSVRRYILVNDFTPPVITLLGSPGVVVPAGQPYVDAGATASDSCWGDLTSSLQVVNNVNTSLPGDYLVQYNVTDGYNNSAEPVFRSVTVLDEAFGTPIEGPDDFEPDDDPNTAPLMPLNDASDAARPLYRHNFDVEGDIDWYKFIAQPGIDLIIQTSGLFSNADTFLSLYRVLAPGEATPDLVDGCTETLVVLNDGTRLAPVACNDDLDFTTRRSFVEHFTEDGGLFYVRIRYSPNATGEVPTFGADTTYSVDNGYFGIVPGSITVSVTDVDTDAPITNAIVKVSPLNLTITVNTAGVYSIGALAQATYTVSVEAPGYATQVQSQSVSDSNLYALDFALVAEPARLTGDYLGPTYKISLGELLRVIQFYNTGGFHCDPNGEDRYAAGKGGHGCPPHSSDYAPFDWKLQLGEILRMIQFYNSGGYHPCEGGEDGFCAGP